jgi:hypothetical protein
MWIKTIPGKGWFSAFRIYDPQAPAFDGTWKLNDIKLVKRSNLLTNFDYKAAWSRVTPVSELLARSGSASTSL